MPWQFAWVAAMDGEGRTCFYQQRFSPGWGLNSLVGFHFSQQASESSSQNGQRWYLFAEHVEVAAGAAHCWAVGDHAVSSVQNPCEPLQWVGILPGSMWVKARATQLF